MSYDNNGNILKKREFEFSLKNILELEEKESTDSVYIYEGDKLQTRIIPKFDGNESSNTETELESFVYNSMGNPTTYRGKNATWNNLRQLTEFDNVLFSYDGLGRRTAKYLIEKTDTTETIKEQIDFAYDNSGRLIKQSNGLEFFYDNSGVAGFVFDSKTYIYRKDTYGNVIAILDDTGAVLVKYIYDAWGNHAIEDNSQTGIGNLNPFRYRSYYYDTETDLYYLKSRYYDPELGRFISIDSIQYIDPETINGLNLYAYCGNNPVMRVDPNGTFFFTALIVGLIVGAAIGFGATVYEDYKDDGQIFNGSVSFGEYVGATILGAAIGGLVGAAAGYALPAMGSFMSSSFSFGGLAIAGASGTTAAISITGAQVLAGVGALVGIGIVLSKASRSSGKERSTDKPSWVNRGMLDDNKSALENATNILNNKYGHGKWAKGPKTEFNKIMKWLMRGLGFK